MTWICAASTVWGYAAMYSDVRVSFLGGGRGNLVQKAYPVAINIAAGFAGSVRIGFDLVESLKDCLEFPNANTWWQPDSVSQEWAPIARQIFERADPLEKKQGAQILLVGASDKSQGLGLKTYITRMVAPDFKPGIMSRMVKQCSIGSGAGIREYKMGLKPLFRLTSGILRAEVGDPGGWAKAMAFAISRELGRRPEPTISREIHTLRVGNWGIDINTNDEDIHPPEGEPIHIRMPKVAQSYREFEELVKQRGSAAAGATC